MAQRQLKVIQLTSEKGFRDADKLKAKGWEIHSVGFTSVTMISPEHFFPFHSSLFKLN